MTPNKLAVYVVADMVLADMVALLVEQFQWNDV